MFTETLTNNQDNMKIISNFSYNYQRYNYNTTEFKQILFEFFNSNEVVSEFLGLINQKYVYLSGSAIMKIISKDDYKLSDLDIYIDITKFNDVEIYSLLKKIEGFMKRSNYYNSGKEFNTYGMNHSKKNKFLSRYIDYKYTRKHKNAYKREMIKYCKKNNIQYGTTDYGRVINTKSCVSEPKKLCLKYNTNIDVDKLVELRKNIHVKSKTIYDKHSNYCLRGHLLDYYKYSHMNMMKNIEIMFISKPIDEFMITTFDLSIVQNYYSMGKIYCNSLEDIRNKTANISLAHFYNRILYSKYEFNNFLIRYNKYTERGYTIYVGGLKLNTDIVAYIKNVRLNKDYYYNLRSIICDDYKRNFHNQDPNTISSIDMVKSCRINKKNYIIRYLVTKFLIQRYKKSLETTQEIKQECFKSGKFMELTGCETVSARELFSRKIMEMVDAKTVPTKQSLEHTQEIDQSLT